MEEISGKRSLEEKYKNIFEIAKKMSLKSYYRKASREWVEEERKKGNKNFEVVSYPFHYDNSQYVYYFSFILMERIPEINVITEQIQDDYTTIEFIQRYELTILTKSSKCLDKYYYQEKSIYSKLNKTHYYISFEGELDLVEIARILLQEKYKISVKDIIKEYYF